MSEPKIVTVDIETYPAEAYVWRLFNEDIPLARLIKPGGILGIGYKWMHQANARWVDMRDNDMAVFARDLLDEADLVIGFNSDSFDVKHINTFITTNHLTPPSPFKSIDLYSKAVKAKFKFQSGKLDHVASQMGLGHKSDDGGFETWVGCMKGDDAAWKRLASYCRQDVRLTEDLYREWLPWIKGHPNLSVYSGSEGQVCPRCDGSNLQRRGTQVALAMRYARFQCQDCGSWSRSAKGESIASDLRPA